MKLEVLKIQLPIKFLFKDGFDPVSALINPETPHVFAQFICPNFKMYFEDWSLADV